MYEYLVMYIFFLLENKEICKLIQSISWAEEGYKMAVSSKDLKVRIFDVRSNSMEIEATSHQNIRDSRVLWVDQNYILTTGMNWAMIKTS